MSHLVLIWYNFTGTSIDSLRARGVWYVGKDLVTEVPSYLLDLIIDYTVSF